MTEGTSTKQTSYNKNLLQREAHSLSFHRTFSGDRAGLSFATPACHPDAGQSGGAEPSRWQETKTNEDTAEELQ